MFFVCETTKKGSLFFRNRAGGNSLLGFQAEIHAYIAISATDAELLINAALLELYLIHEYSIERTGLS